jgi:hypothetical protein
MTAVFNPWRTYVASLVVAFALVTCGYSAVTSEPAGAVEGKPFGITKFTMQTTEPTKVTSLGHEEYEFLNEPYSFTQAGGHPSALTTIVEFASEEIQEPRGPNMVVEPARDPKDVIVSLPPGLLGNPVAVPRCPLAIALSGDIRCPSSTQVGVARIELFGGKEVLGAIVNVTPEEGQSAEFAIETNAKVTFLETAHLVRTPEGYGFTVASNNIPLAEIVRVEETFWGVPADPRNDPMRGRFCIALRGKPLGCSTNGDNGGLSSGVPQVPFLTMPTNCAGGPETAEIRADSWEQPGQVNENQEYSGYATTAAERPLPTVVTGPQVGFTGCDLLQFHPSILVEPDSLLADSPVGLGVNIQVPQPEEPEVPGTPHLRDAVVTLPEGMSVSPGVVDGIQACDASGPQGINFTGPLSEERGPNGELQLAPGHCPDASIVGTAEAVTPLLDTPVKGHIYLARPGCGNADLGQEPCTEQDALDGNLYKLYLELGGTGEFAKTGIQIKVAGSTEANPATGQLTTRFLENPQTPFSELKVHLNGGPRAPIDNPAVCGPAETTSHFTPWSAPGETPGHVFVAGTPDATPSSFFDVEGCSNPPALSPGFVAGTVTPEAGQFSSFTVNLSRKDREQYVKGIQMHTPPGLLAMLSSVPLCQEAAANAGACLASSEIGTTRVASGAGSHPFEIEGGVYLTGSYKGAPFGLSVITPAKAGPFNLGVVVVRARIDIDSQDSTAIITFDETGPHAIPQIIFGVPLRLQRITANIDRPGFMFNPTNCGAQQIRAAIAGSQEALANVSSPFAVGGCKSLVFKPKFTASTNGSTSRIKGASLDVKLSYPAGSFGSAANIARAKVSLPKQLPSRLTTLQRACPAATFERDPAACPKGSVVGVVRAKTPVLPVGLSGPVYFVSHGGEAFPSLVVVLQGDNVRVDLTGTTFINKAGITSSTFKTVPDVPVNTFELYLPEGRFSALAANGNLCHFQGKLKMPTEFVAQNGAVLRQSTKIAVTACKGKKKANGAARPTISKGGTGR